MSSQFPGYAYDVFVSYRQNDNRSGWVTEFVRALEEELAATIKEPVSVYFDTNPHDGLLETHNVDKSLEAKLRCLVFIPILSHTYCDPKSFAWQKEFCAFNKLVQQDLNGRDVILSNGNIASRILPIKIHDLEAEDVATLEQEMGGPLRALEFIYKEAGVNRPLKPGDSRNENQNKTDYRNQINKVANAVKELIFSLKRQSTLTASDANLRESQPLKQKVRYPTVWRGLFLLLLIFIGYFVYRTIFGGGPTNAIDASIAVLPFDDLTPSGNSEYLGDGIADEIINSLTNIRGLKVSGRTSSFQFKGEKVDIRTIGERLKVGYVLEGSIQKYENDFRITAQLIRTEDNFHAWSERFDLREVNIFKIQDIIADAIVEKLKLTLTPYEKNQITKKETSQKAYAEFLKGVHQFKNEHYHEAEVYALRATQLDSNYAPAFALVGLIKGRIIYDYVIGQPHPDSVREAVRYAKRATELDPTLPEGYSALGLVTWMTQHDFVKARIYFDKSLELNPSSSLIRNRYAYFLTWMGDFAKASQLNRQAITQDPVDYNSYFLLFDSAFYNRDPVAGSKILSQYEQLFGKDGRWTQQRMSLDYIKGNFQDLIRRADSITISGGQLYPLDKSLLARTYLLSGNFLQASRIKSQLIRESSDPRKKTCFALGLIYAVENKPDSCFHFLSLAVERFENWPITLKIDPDLKRYQKDPRYGEVYRTMGFEKYDQWMSEN